MARASKKAGIETQLRSLEEIVKKLEDGSLPLEESLVLFEEGIRLSRDLQAALQAASMKVTQLLEGDPPTEKALPMPDEEGKEP